MTVQESDIRLPATIDVDDALRDFRFKSASYCRTEVRAPWGFSLPYEAGVRFHAVIEGEAWMLADGGAPLKLAQGDLVLLPRGSAHVLMDDPARDVDRPVLTPEWIEGDFYAFETDGGGDRALIVCSTLSFELPGWPPIAALLPSVLHLPADALNDAALPPLVALMGREAREQKPGWMTLVARTAEIIATTVVRNWLGKVDGSGEIAVLRDPGIRRVVAAVQARPEGPWPIEALAQEAGLSRSVFQKRFKAVMNQTPAAYITGVKMRLAAGWLSAGTVSIGQAAAGLGFESDAAFSRAFKRTIGLAPGSFRRQARPSD